MRREEGEEEEEEGEESVSCVSKLLSGVARLLQVEGGGALWECGCSRAATTEGGWCSHSTAQLTLAC